jgi:protein-S-isoprenylcysteine O-methyltransferase Ste14
MKVLGITLLLSGLFFVLYTIFSDPGSTSPTASWAPWVGILLFITGGVTYFVARNEE